MNAKLLLIMELIYRKLQNLGGSLYVSLPKSWTNKYELKEKSSVALKLHDDGTLTIMPKIEQQSEVLNEEIVLEADEYVIWELLKKSLAGITNIVITSVREINKPLRKNIKRYVNRLPNTEIIEETKHRMTIQNFGYKEIPTKKLVQRLLYLVANMFEDLRKNSFDDVYDNFEQLRKFYFILVIHIRTYLRTGIYISSNSDFTPLEAMDYRMFCEKIEEIGEILTYIAQSQIFEKTNPLLNFYMEVEQYYNQVMNAFLQKNDKLAFLTWIGKDQIFDKANLLLKSLIPNDQEGVKNLMRIAQNCKDMAALI
ncbi:MAG: AbrB/MazE/SpoVT family DNA-binding domain-containing protein [Promethearchaeota archaeon]|jgi:phosphate uptake regulator